MVLADLSLKVRKIVIVIVISYCLLVSIMNDRLDKRRLSSRRVQRLLTIAQKRNGEEISKDYLAFLNRNKDEFSYS